MRLLWLLLHALSPKDVLHPSLSSRLTVYLRYTPPCIPPTKVPPLPYSDVLWARTLLHHPHRSWPRKVWLGNSSLAHEPGVDASYDDVQSDGRCAVCNEGMCIQTEPVV
jgi:hypothetical protein